MKKIRHNEEKEIILWSLLVITIKMWLKAVSRYDTICVYGYNNIIIVNHPQGCKYNVARLRKWKNSKDLVKPLKAMSEYLKKTKTR